MGDSMLKGLTLAKIEFLKNLRNNRLFIIFFITIATIFFIYFKAFKLNERINFGTLISHLFLINLINILILSTNTIWEELKSDSLKILFSSDLKVQHYLAGKMFFATLTNIFFQLIITSFVFPLNLKHFLHFLPNLSLYFLFWAILFSISLPLFLFLLSVFFLIIQILWFIFFYFLVFHL